MKKTIIAAGASFALAAMPVVGVFAATSAVTDQFNLTLSETCSISRTGAAASAVTDTSSNLSFTDGTGTYAATLAAGKAATIGTSTFSVTCNDTNYGHSLAVQFTNLSGSVDSTNHSIAYDGTTAVADGASRWNATATENTTLGVSSGLIAATETSVGSGTYDFALYGGTSKNKTAVSSQTFNVEYNVSTATTQAATSYTGSAQYTLTYGV